MSISKEKYLSTYNLKVYYCVIEGFYKVSDWSEWMGVEIAEK